MNLWQECNLRESHTLICCQEEKNEKSSGILKSNKILFQHKLLLKQMKILPEHNSTT